MNSGAIPEERLTSELLASFLVDALLRAGLIQGHDLDSARAVVAEEILVRHLSGELDFP